jgi:hypothetical protein
MKFRVAKRTAESTPYHPWLGLGPIEDLAEYLDYDFDPDGVFRLPKNSVVTISATIGRNSTFQEGRRIEIDLQPAVDVAHMIASYYWRSQVWPARVAFEVFAILRELCIQHAHRSAAEFVSTFAERRLVELITDSELGIVEPHQGLFSSSRAQMFGALDERELVKQLATFQIFHELGHLIASRSRRSTEQSSPGEIDVEELNCDEFGCSELDIAYGGSLGIEFLKSIPASIFLSILVWTLGQNFSRLEKAEFRTQTFATALRRSRAATVRVYRYGHRTEPPSEQQEMGALRHFPVFEALLRILDKFFTEAVSNDPEMFNFQGFATKTVPATPQALAAAPPEEMRSSRAPWEMIWTKEDNAAQEMANILRGLRKAHDHRPRSRPMLGLQMHRP